MKFLVDTNVILDALMARVPFDESAKEIFLRAEAKKGKFFIAPSSVATIDYFYSKYVGRNESLKQIRNLMKLFDVAAINKKIILTATESGFADFEDAIIYSSARASKVDAIITRNTKDFKKSKIPIYSPDQVKWQ